MKIKLAPQLRVNLYFCAALSIGYYLVLACLLSDLWITVAMEFPVFVVLMALFGLWPVLLWFPNRKKLSTVFIEENMIRSYLYGKMKCEVYTDRDVYYTVFESNLFQGVRQWGRYIILSNEPFMFTQCAGSNGFLDLKHPDASHYDDSKQIVVPYNDKTIPLLTVENWHSL